ncbi:hypothetical protein LWI29_002853 [Acer saccharum]|uniref:DUF4220 domain-containing protein n=1 Tax=Acer saccharum TaxID=4024 RepID=A0AA39SC80_ACESA|nr:hypothetical protein LWI29_002853 [Acer saccharum]
MALGFMYDKLYTKAPLLYTRWGLGLRVITFFLTSSVLVLFPPVDIHDKHKFSNTDVTITFILLVGAIILELYSAVLILSSDRFLYWLIVNGNPSTEKALESFLTQKRWSNNMSQFSLLSFIIKEKPLPCLNILKHLRLDKRIDKQWYAADMEIPKNLKTLICEYLQEKAKDSIPVWGQTGPKHSIPVWGQTGPKHSVPVDLVGPNSIPVDPVGPNFTEELEKSILAWHVATDIRALFLNVKLPSRVGSASIPSTAVEDIFKIIEKALGFMYDNLYTKAPLLYTRWGLGLRVITFFLTSSVLVLFPVVVIHDKHKFSNTDVTITYILLAGAIILELYSAVLILSSDRFLVWLIKRRKYSTKKALKCFLKEKRWSTNMSQFSLLSFIIKEKPLPCLNFLKHLRLDKSLTKQRYAVDMKIPNNLKKLICLYLQEKSKSRNGPTDDSVPVDPVGLNFTEELEKSILAWHVVTDIRYELDGEEIKQLGHDFELHCGLICQISRYMFYLLLRHPDMISEGSMNQIKLQSILLACRSILWAARSQQFTSKIEACNFLEELLTVPETYLDQRHLVLEGDDDNDIKIFFKDRLPGLVIKLSKQFFSSSLTKILHQLIQDCSIR